MRSPANKKNKNMESDASATSSVVRRERFLPKMAMRILLVEADDSTRHIIAALLRKCGYKVAAVSDGLKAWELLKGSLHNIDLILTEVDLPSISGYALLTLIMEHEICKHIPIIMMSSRDSVNTVYRCMLRGAADFLVKPIRKNELRNLWQHVWRRHALGGGAQGPLHECVVQQNACSSHSSGHKAGIQRSPECFEISSDAQSSCSKPDMDNEGDDIEDISRSTQSNWDTSLPNDEDLRKEELCHEATIRLTMSNEAGAPRIDASRRTNTEITTSVRGCVRNSGLTSDDHHAPLIKQAIDLIGAFDSHLKCDYMSGPISTRNNEDYSPLLALSLTRSHPTRTVNQYTNEKLRPIQSGQSISPKTFNQKDFETDSDKQLSNHGSDNSFATRGPWTTPYNHVPSSCAKPGAAEIGLYSPQQRLLPLPVAVEGIRFELLRSAYSSSVTPGESSYHLNPFLLLNCETRTSQQLHCLTDQNNSHATTHNESENGHKSESTIDFQHFVSVSGTHQSTKSSSPNDAHLHTSCGTNGNNLVGNNLVPKVKVKTPAEGREEAISLAHDMKSQREAAVTKFRLKRKDRCFDKKVRYESRKQLAEQRPRVKGQFVRQIQS